MYDIFTKDSAVTIVRTCLGRNPRVRTVDRLRYGMWKVFKIFKWEKDFMKIQKAQPQNHQVESILVE